MTSKTQNYDMDSVITALKDRMARSACFHLEAVNPRLAITLQLSGLLDEKEEYTGITPEILAALKDPNARVKSLLGPYIFYKATGGRDGEESQFSIDVSSFLLANEIELRSAAINYFEELRISNPPLVSAKTADLLVRKLNLVKSDSVTWKTDASEIYDSIQDDIFISFSAVRQSIEQNFPDGIIKNLPKLIRPTISSLDALQSIVLSTTEDIACKNVIDECLVFTEMADSLNHYLHFLGTLPFREEYSLGVIAVKWFDRGESIENIWEKMWTWANANNSPIARYHCTSAYLDHPSLIPVNCEDMVWRSAVDIVAIFSNSTSQAAQEWTFLKQLAQHYFRFISCWVPGSLGDPAARYAWWMAHSIYDALVTDNIMLGEIIEEILTAEMHKSNVIWRMSLPNTEQSALSISTQLDSLLWSFGILRRFNASLLNKIARNSSRDLKEFFHSSLIYGILFDSKVSERRPVDSLYSFDSGLENSIKAWREHRDDVYSAEVYDSLLQNYNSFNDPLKFVSAFREIVSEDESSQFMIANWSRALAVRGIFPVEEMWELISDSDWFYLAFTKIGLNSIETIFLSFSTAFQGDRNKISRLPHIYANMCGRILDDENRAKLVFFYVAISGIHANSVSALQRLLSARSDRNYRQIAQDFKAWVSQSRFGPPWLVARTRALMPVLSSA